MNEAKYNKWDVERALSQARVYNPNMGVYKAHATNSNFNQNILLTNGRITILWEELQDKDCLGENRLRNIANRFEPNVKEPTIPVPDNTNQAELENATPEKESAWKRFWRNFVTRF